jgi:hypothetical protein
MRRPTLTLALAAILVVGACGGGSSDKKAAKSSAATSAPTTTTTVAPTTTTTLGAAAATARAKQVNLQLTDFPAGWKASPPTQDDPGDELFTQQAAACLKIPDPKLNEISDTASDDFADAENATASSSVTFVKDPAVAKNELTAVRGPSGIPCLKSGVDALLTKVAQAQSFKVEGTTLEAAPPPAVGDDSAAITFTATISASGQTVTVYGDIILFLKGNEAISLTYFDVAKRFDPILGQSLTQKVVSRA